MSTLAFPREAAPPSSRAISIGLEQIAFGALCAFVFCLPWERGQGTTYLPILGVATFALTLLSGAITPRRRPLMDVHWWMIAFAAWASMSLLWTLDWNATLARAMTYLQLVTLAWLVWTLGSSEWRIFALMQSYMLGTFVCVYGTFVNLFAGRSYGQIDEDSPRSARFIMTGMNPNDVGLLLAPSIAIALYLLIRRKANPVFCWIQLILAVTTILLSGSRGALLASSASVAMFPLALAKLPRWGKIVAGIAMGCAIGMAIYFVPPDTWQRLFRVGTDLTQGTMTHRTQIWSASMDVFREHPLIGVGADAHPAAVVRILARAMVAHNTFLSVLVELGVIGALLLAGLLAAAFYCAARMRGLERLFWSLVLLTWCIGAFAGTWEYRKATWFLFSMVAAHAYTRTKRRVRQEGAAPNVWHFRAH